jgi:Tfp pilus assembly protein PilV
MKLSEPTVQRARSNEGYTLAEAMVATFVLGIVVVSLYAGFASGFAVVQAARENLRASQIMVQKMETVRLFKWSQVTSTNYIKPTFTEYYDPIGAKTGNGGTIYSGSISLDTATVPPAYRNNMRAVTVTLNWTNSTGKTSAPLVRSRQMQTYVARYGLQNYIP